MAGGAGALLGNGRIDFSEEPGLVKTGYEGETTQVPERSSLVQLDLLERDAELATVGGFVAAIADGGRLVAIEGPPGIGKTALMAETRARANEAGLHVLAARG